MSRLLLTSLVFSILCCFAFGQTDMTRGAKYFVPKKIFDLRYAAEDSIGFRIRNDDTLIEVIKFNQPKGVAVPYEYKDSTFLNQYTKIAFRPRKEDSTDSQTMKYWKNPIRVYFAKNVPKRVQKGMMKFAEEIDAHIDSLQIQQVKTVEDSNYIIYYDKDYQFERQLETNRKSAYYIYWHNKNSQIYKGYLRISSNIDVTERVQLNRIKELFFQTLGFFQPDPSMQCESYFSNCYSDKKSLNQLDTELLRYHYSYGICKGTTKNSFLKQHQKIQSDMKTNGNTKAMIYQTY